MSETTSQAEAARWWQTAWAWLRQRAAALVLALTSKAAAFARWRIEHPTVLGAALDALLIIVVAGCFAALVLALPWPKPARLVQPVTISAADQLQSLESRVSALESIVAGLMAATPAPASPSARRPATASPAAAVTANATPAPPTGQTDLDRRLAEFQRRIDATPSPTTLKETAK